MRLVSCLLGINKYHKREASYVVRNEEGGGGKVGEQIVLN